MYVDDIFLAGRERWYLHLIVQNMSEKETIRIKEEVLKLWYIIIYWNIELETLSFDI